MNLFIETQTRDDLIRLGTVLGRVFEDVSKTEPWIVTMGGDAAAGKSLIALAMDKVFQPEFYSDDIPQDLSANDMMDRYHDDPVIFENFCGELALDTDAFDNRLENITQSCPSSSVILISNFWRTLSGNFNYAADGLMSNKLDMNIDIFIQDESAYPEDENFTRSVIITVEKTELCAALKEPLQQMQLTLA